LFDMFLFYENDSTIKKQRVLLHAQLIRTNLLWEKMMSWLIVTCKARHILAPKERRMASQRTNKNSMSFSQIEKNWVFVKKREHPHIWIWCYHSRSKILRAKNCCLRMSEIIRNIFWSSISVRKSTHESNQTRTKFWTFNRRRNLNGRSCLLLSFSSSTGDLHLLIPLSISN